jgi:hydroxymethylbilane synthase
MPQLILGSRRSRLALAQTEQVAATLRELHGPLLKVEIQTFSTRGDQVLDRSLPSIGGKGLFTAELEEALRSGQIQAAVHSLKDLPTELPDGLALLALPARADSRDALLLRADRREAFRASVAADPLTFEPRDLLGGVPEGGSVGTSSVRRAAMLRRLRPDLQIRDVRGNVETRIRKLDEGQFDALVMACAGLDRLGLGDRVDRRLGPPWIGAPGQGAIAVEGRADDLETQLLLQPLDDRPTRLCVECERQVLAALGGGCSVPVAVSVRAAGERLLAEGLVIRPDGKEAAHAERKGEATREGARRLGRTLARELFERGAGRILGTGLEPPPQPFPASAGEGEA